MNDKSPICLAPWNSILVDTNKDVKNTPANARKIYNIIMKEEADVNEVLSKRAKKQKVLPSKLTRGITEVTQSHQ